MPKVQTILPNLYTISFDQQHRFWQSDVNWQEPYFAGVLHYHFETELERTAGDLYIMIKRSIAFLNDVFVLKQDLAEKQDALNFLQFQASTSILSFVTQNKLFPYSFDWLSNSIADEVNNETNRELSPARIAEFIVTENPYIREFFGQAFCSWTHDLFYYSRSTGGHNELAQYYLQEYLRSFLVIAEVERRTQHTMAVAQIATWCLNHKKENEIRACNEILNSIYKSSGDEETKKVIAFHFSVADRNDSDLTKTQWCRLVLNQYEHFLRGHEKLQLVVNLYQHDTNLILQNLDQILLTLEEYVTKRDGKEGKLYQYHRSRIFSIFERILHRLVVNRLVEEACKIVAAYFQVPVEKTIEQPVLFIVPNTAEGPLYCFANKTLHVQAEPLLQIPEIIVLQNKFLGTSHTFNNDLNFVLESPERSGVPTPKLGNSFQQKLSGYMNCGKLLEYEKLAECSGYFMLYGSQLNLQNVVSLETGRTLPIIQSFYKQSYPVKIQKVFIWEGFNQFAETERLGLEEIFRNNEVQVHNLSCFEASKEDFLSHYANSEYDVFWILGHGEFAHHEAHESFLDLGNGIEVSISDLKSVRLHRQDRRLLIIDACDGATTSLANSPDSIGIGVSTVDEYQSLMSHAWPVQNLPSTVLGLLLARYLMTESTYAEAHCKTISTFYDGMDSVLAVLHGYCDKPDVIERIQNGNFDYKSFYCWGSLNFFV